MNPESENLEKLQKLLALKRHEQPPPRYFRDFSNQVIARLQADEAAESLTWWQRWGLDFDFKPALVCGAGVVVCSLLSGGVILSRQQIGESVHAEMAFQPNGDQVVASAPSGMLATTGLHPIDNPDEIPGSTDPVISTSSAFSPFRQFTLGAQRVSFNTGFSGN